MQKKNRQIQNNPIIIIIYIFMFIFFVNWILGLVVTLVLAMVLAIFVLKNRKLAAEYYAKFLQLQMKEPIINNGKFDLLKNSFKVLNTNVDNLPEGENQEIENFKIALNSLNKQTRLERRKKYLHIALNSTLDEAREIISRLPVSDRILIEAGTPLIKIYGTDAVVRIKAMAPVGTYIVADNKCADLADREVELMAMAGANAATCLGVATIETIDLFIEKCQEYNIDSMLDMMNVENPQILLKKLKKLPNVVILHRGVDESEFSKEKQIPFYQIKQIKGSFDVLVAVAGGDTINEVQRAIFNDADIVVVWKNFYQASAETASLAETFIKEI